jgi:hypothetical protein
VTIEMHCTNEMFEPVMMLSTSTFDGVAFLPYRVALPIDIQQCDVSEFTSL